MGYVDISAELAAIMEAVYGEQVRGSIHDAIQKMYEVVEADVTLVDTTLTVSGAAADAKVVGDTTLRFKGTLGSGAEEWDVTDLNTVTETGIYKVSSAMDLDNSPFMAGTAWWLIVFNNGTSGVSVTQLALEMGMDEYSQPLSYVRFYSVTRNRWSFWKSYVPMVDPSLSTEGAAADAKAVGDRLTDLEYVPIDITSFTSSPNMAEYGSAIASVTLSYKLNKEPATLKLAGETIQNTTQGSMSVNTSTVTTVKSWTLVATDEGSPNHAAASDSATCNFLYSDKVHWGAAPIPNAINSSFVLSLSGNALSLTRVREFTVTAGANDYIWYCLPDTSSYGTPKFSSGGFDGGFQKVYTFSHTNAYGVAKQYAVWRSDNKNLGTTKVTVT